MRRQLVARLIEGGPIDAERDMAGEEVATRRRCRVLDGRREQRQGRRARAEHGGKVAPDLWRDE